MNHKQSTTFEDAKSVLTTLIDHGYLAMFAGGCVRDRLLGVTPHDYDIASNAKPQEAKVMFGKMGFRVVPTGVEHGTITVITHSGPVEVTTLRKDVKTDGRHAIVSFDGATFADDAARRDFTINAMFEDLDGKIHDFHGGQLDLKNKILRFVGNPVERIREDYLRILRFFRFWARLGFEADHDAIMAIKAEVKGLIRVSQERITNELWGICAAKFSAEPFKCMQETGVLTVIIPEAVTFNHTFLLILRDASLTELPLRPWIVLSLALGVLEAESLPASQILSIAKRLRFSDKQSNTLAEIFRGWQECTVVERDIASALLFAEQLESHNPEQNLVSFFGPIWHFFSRHQKTSEKREKLGWLIATDQTFQERRRMQLPVSGKDVMDILPELKGREIGDIITKTRKSFLNGEWQSRHEGLDFLRKL